MAIIEVLSPSERMAKKRALRGLPADVQHTIERLSDSLEELVRRCGIARNYQRMFSGVERGDSNLELCRTCGVFLPPLENPRQHPGKCLPYVMKDVA